MTILNSTPSTVLLDAGDLLDETEKIVSFIQSITLINPMSGGELSLTSTQADGLYFVLEKVKENMAKIGEMMDSARLGANHE